MKTMGSGLTASMTTSLQKFSVVPSGQQPMFSLRSRHSNNSRINVILLLLGGIESNPGPPTRPIIQRIARINEIRLGTINARSAVQKSSLIRDLIHSNRLDILVLTETWFRPDMPNEILNDVSPDNYSIIHEFRTTGRGGGISVIHRYHICIRRLKATVSNS